MATTTNYGWTTPDDTSLVKDGASAIRTLGSSIDTTVFTNASAAIPKTIVDAKGDLIAATASDTVSRLAVGANGTVLTADTAESTGIKWALPAAASTSFSLLNAGGTTLTGAQTVTVSGISGMDKLYIYIAGFSSASATSTFYLRLNGDTGSNYLNYGTFAVYTSGEPNYERVGSTTSGFFLGRVAGAAQSGNAGITILGCKSGGVKVADIKGSGSDESNSRMYSTNSMYNQTGAITSVSVFSDTGNLDAGTIFVYGSSN
jgi:hypothetical protein